jgi:predicted nucleic acid-binding protein
MIVRTGALKDTVNVFSFSCFLVFFVLIAVLRKTLKVESQELAEKQRIFIKEKSALVPLDESIAIESAKVQTRIKKEIDGWGLAGSIVYATAIVKKAEVVTGDEHFKKLKNVFFIK